MNDSQTARSRPDGKALPAERARARRPVWPALALIGGLAFPGAASAQDGTLAVQQFQPNPGGALNYNQVQGAQTLDSFKPSFGLYLNFAQKPLVYTAAAPYGTTTLLERQVGADILAAIGLGDRFQIGLALPVTLNQAVGSSDLFTVPAAASTAVGDLRFAPKVKLFGSNRGLGLALAATVGLPTGDATAYSGEQGITIKPELLLELGGERLRAGLNVGYLLRPVEEFINLAVGSELTYGVGVAFALKPDRFSLIGEVFGRASFPTEGITASVLPLEALISARFNPARGHAITLGAGPGITLGYGTPTWRALLGYSFTMPEKAAPEPVVNHDRDGDGLLDEVDKCPDQPEDKDGFQDEDGCPDPDNDGDGLADSKDKCPDQAEDVDTFQDEDGCPDPDNDADGIPDTADKCPLEAEIKNGIADEDGCPEVDTDGDGITDEQDQCPKKPETKNGFKDEDGCPELDTDEDGIVDEQDQCPKKPETKNGFKDEDGCPEIDTDGDGLFDGQDQCPNKPETKNSYQDDDGCPDKLPEIKMEAMEIKVDEKVYFDTGKATLKPQSRELLSRVAQVLKANPQVKGVRIGGHTDDRGGAAMNQDLSQRRAESVKQYLVEQGIEADRLNPVGFGQSRPIASNKTEEGREKNRRVQFTIVKMDPATEPPK